MRLRSSLQGLKLDQSIVTIGSFDGVHAGHQSIIRRVVEAAHKEKIPAVVVTFFPHPASVLRKINIPFYLTGPEERAWLLGELGVDEVVTLKFTPKMASLLPEDFIDELNQHLGIRELWVGHDFALGRNRLGDYDRLNQIGREMGFGVKTLVPVDLDDQIISSSAIRTALSRGEVKRVALMLGRLYGITGEVVKGDGRGKLIGIPTANMAVWKEQLLPRNGVYAGWAIVEGSRFQAVTNLGLRPTFENEDVEAHLEVHLLDFHQNLYGKKIRFEFLEFLRPEQKFGSIQDLIDQIHTDIQNTRQEFKHGASAPDLPARSANPQP